MLSTPRARRLADPSLHLAPVALALALAIAFVAGVVSSVLVRLPVDTGRIAAMPAPAPTFDAVRFRAEEREPLGIAVPSPTFDAVLFRAEERQPLSTSSP